MRKTWLMKLSLLSISLVLTSNTAIASALPMMLGYFNDQSASSVELLMTIPQLTVVIFIALSSLIAKAIGRNKLCLTWVVACWSCWRVTCLHCQLLFIDDLPLSIGCWLWSLQLVGSQYDQRIF